MNIDKTSTRAFPFDKPEEVIKLRASNNGRFFEDQNGNPFFYLGDTAWRLFKQLNREQVELYLANRAAKGFTVIQAYVLRGLQLANIYGDFPLIDEDPTRPNEAFFANVDHIVERAAEYGLCMGLVTNFGEHVCRGVGHAESFEKNEQVLDEKTGYIYGRFLGERYRGKPVIWFLGGDRKPIGDEEVWGAIARGLREGSNSEQLVSYHGPGDPSTPSSSCWFHRESWLDFNTIQSGHGWSIPNYQYVAKDYALQPVKPTIDMEPSYENCLDVKHKSSRRMDAHQVRQAAYWAMLAGAAGHGYGCIDVCHFQSDDMLPDYSHPMKKFPSNTDWRVAIDFEGAAHMGIMRRLFELRPWYQLIPDQSVITHGQSDGEDHIQAARAADHGFALAYTPKGKAFSVDLSVIRTGRVLARWYDPRNGDWLPIGEFRGKRSQYFTPPSTDDQNDWILVLEDAAENYTIG